MKSHLKPPLKPPPSSVAILALILCAVTTVAALQSSSPAPQIVTSSSYELAQANQTTEQQASISSHSTATNTTTTTTSESHIQMSTPAFQIDQQSLISSKNLMTRLLPMCTLGNDTFQLGERWNPNLPPFGVQVCVQCECTIRQRKSCYEPKTTCRRITNECPIIDSCPDGKKPVTSPGQCCKSCQSTTPQAQEAQVPAIEGSLDGRLWAIIHRRREQFFYRNERIKEYQAILKNYEACQRRTSGSGEEQQLQPAANAKPTSTNKMAPKGAGKNELNGIDSRLAFKSLHDSHESNQISPVAKHSNRNSNNSETGNNSSKPIDDTMKYDEQHPNDVQPATNNIGATISNMSGSRNINRFVYATMATQSPNSSNSNSSNHKQQQPKSKFIVTAFNTCTLGNETFEIGDKWSPDLPTLGIQVCVQCNCVAFKVKGKACYGTKVTCERIDDKCPQIPDTCPDGRLPVALPGQCCKSCQQLADLSIEQQQQQQLEVIMPQKSEQIIREYQTLTKQYPSCSKQTRFLANAPIASNASTTPTSTTTTTTIAPPSNISKRNSNSRRSRRIKQNRFHNSNS